MFYETQQICYQDTWNVSSEELLSQAQVPECHRCFKAGHMLAQDDEHSEWSLTCKKKNGGDVRKNVWIYLRIVTK